jgi:hypothetical protein
MNENDLMSRLSASKAIMDSPKFAKSRNTMNDGLPPTSLQDFDVPAAKYNIPQEYLQEQPQQMSHPYLSSIPKENTKLPDEIKRLMMEHPISQPNQPNATLSNDLIEKASRLMKGNDSNYIPESAKPKMTQPQQSNNAPSNLDYKVIQKMITEAVNDALRENGLIVESAEKANEVFSFKVGKHIFEGKVTKIKKLS